ncbi:MAG: biotin/lipoyl-containing protein [Bacteroidota bacterium]
MTKLYADINSESYEVEYISRNRIILNGKEYQVELEPLEKNIYQIVLNNKRHKIFIDEIESGVFHSITSGETFTVSIESDLERKAKKILNKNINQNSNKNIKAPMNGLIVKINKNVGDKVEKGESLIVLEAMKMENEIKSSTSGIIKTSICEVGKSVDREELLFIIE